MAKDILSFFGLIFLTLIVIIAVMGMGLFYDSIGIIKLPEAWVETPMSFLTPAPVKVSTVGASKVEWSNPLDRLPTRKSPSNAADSSLDQPVVAAQPVIEPTNTPRPRPTITPVPPMDPQVYQAEVMVRMKSFAAALERWLDANNRLAKDNALLNDEAWRSEVKQDLDKIDSTGRALAAVGPAPIQYRAIAGWLKKSSSEATALRQSYLKALNTGGANDFQAAGEHFEAIRENLALAVKEMTAAGWTFQ